jgi:hypothetical protein
MPADLSIANSVIAAFAQGAQERLRREALEQQKLEHQQRLENEDKRIGFEGERIELERERVNNALKSAQLAPAYRSKCRGSYSIFRRRSWSSYSSGARYCNYESTF